MAVFSHVPLFAQIGRHQNKYPTAEGN